jgi:hypothetical protein
MDSKMNEEEPEPIILDLKASEKFFSWLKKTIFNLIVGLLVIMGLTIIVLSAYFSYSISDSSMYLIIGNELAEWRTVFRIVMFLIGLSTGIVHIYVAWLLNEKLKTWRESARNVT